MNDTNKFDIAYSDQQNKFRGLVSEYRSRRFVMSQDARSSLKFRDGMHRLFLEARVRLHSSQFPRFLKWIRHQIDAQLADFANLPVGYEELAGIYTSAPVVTLERELLWISARIKADVTRLNEFRAYATEVEQLVFNGDVAGAIEVLAVIDHCFGVTLWSVQLRVALEHHLGGLERQKRYTAEVRAVYKRGLLGFVTYHTSVRNEERTTLAKFQDDIKARIEGQQVYEPFIKTYLRYRLAAEWPEASTGLADILRVEQSHSLIDIYETFVAVAQEITRRDEDLPIRGVLAKCLHSMDGLDDFRLAKILYLLERKIGSVKQLHPRNTEISDALFLGNARYSFISGRRIAKANRGLDPWHLIYEGIALAHGVRRGGRELRRPTDIPRLIGRFMGRGDCTDDSFSQLQKLVINLRGLPTAAGLIDMLPLVCPSRPDDPWQPWVIGLNSPSVGVEDLHPKADLTLWSEATGNRSMTPTEEVWSCFYGVRRDNLSVSQPALRLALMAGMLREQRFQEVLSLNEDNIKWPEPLRVLATSLLLHVYYATGDRQAVIELIANEGSRTDSRRRLLPIIPSLEQYQYADYEAISAPLAAPIALHLLWTANENNVTASYLRFATRSMIRASGVTRPSKLFDIADKYPRHQLVYFLKAVCMPHILDVSRVLKGTREVKEERQAICVGLGSLDPANSDEYQNEVITISNELALDEGQWIVDSTRVYVDNAALARWATKELAEDLARYRDLLGVDIGTNQNFDDVLKELAVTASQRSTFTPENEADAVLVSILRRLGEEFLNNSSFGFDFYLSKRIRHQSFIGLIRSPLEFAGLITTRETESGAHHRNDLWLDKFTCVSAETKEALNEAFAKFSASFDDTLTAAKDKSLHVRSQEHPAGLMYLDLTPQLITLARALSRMKETSLQEFFSTSVLILWAAMEPSLAKTRTFISVELKTKIAEIFDQLRATVRRLAEHHPATLDFDMAIGRHSTEVQRALDDVKTWFSHADIEAHKQYFPLEQAVDIAIDSALKCHRAFEPIITRQVSGDMVLAASSLVFVHDVLFVALDNARMHSGYKQPKMTVSVLANFDDCTALTIKVTSEVKPQNVAAKEESLREIRQIIESGNFGRRTRKEGRSGFFKLAAVVKQSSKGQIHFGFTKAGEFELTVIYSLLIQELNQPNQGNEPYQSALIGLSND